MIQKFKLLIVSLAALLLGGVAVAPAVVQAQSVNDVCAGVGQVTGNGDCTPAAGSKSVSDIMKLVLRIMETIVGLISVIVIIMAGLRYVTSGGDSNAVSSAKNQIVYALIGIAIVALSETIVQFVLNRLK